MPRFWIFFYALAAAFGYQAPVAPAAVSGAELARLIHDAGLDPADCYRVRDVSFLKDDIRLYSPPTSKAVTAR